MKVTDVSQLKDHTNDKSLFYGRLFFHQQLFFSSNTHQPLNLFVSTEWECNTKFT